MNPHPQRLQALRKKGFKLQAESLRLNGLPAYSIRRGNRAFFGNPFKVADAVSAGRPDPQAWVVWAFEEWLKPDGDAQFRGLYPEKRERLLANLWRLSGKNLACACAMSQPCHGDVLLRLANPEG
jgi:Domain of unknown function (DUF4326)